MSLKEEVKRMQKELAITSIQNLQMKRQVIEFTIEKGSFNWNSPGPFACINIKGWFKLLGSAISLKNQGVIIG